MGSGSQALVFLISVIFDLYIWAIFLRIILQLMRADYYNPLSQIVIKLTDPPLAIFHKILPTRRGIDIAAIIFVFLVVLLKAFLLLLVLGIPPQPIGVLLIAAADIVKQLLSLYFYILFIVIISSWFANRAINPTLSLLVKITEPLLLPLRKVMPPIAGMDFSPLVIILIIKVLEIFLYSFTLGF
jgi:YggT family protein